MDFSSRSRRIDRHHDRQRNRPTPYPKDDVLGSRPGGNKEPPFNRVFVSNIPYEEKWQKIKDIFREEVGEVTYAEVMTDDQGKSKGFGIVEFRTRELAVKAVEIMKDYQIRDRKLVVKEDFYGDFLKKSLRRDITSQSRRGNGDISYAMPPPMPLPSMPPPMPVNMPPPMQETSDSVTPSLDQKIQNITQGAPIGKTVFIANLAYTVSYPKLKEVFSLAGNIEKIDLHLDKDNKSKGMATITYETPLEALEAISMFNKQLLYDRPMLVKMDRDNAQMGKKVLPSGLQSIGPSLKLSSRSKEKQQRGTSETDADGFTKLEMLSAQKEFLEKTLGIHLSGVSGSTANQLGTGGFSGIPGLLKPSAENIGANFPSLNQASLPSNSQIADLAAALAMQSSSDINAMRGHGSTKSSDRSTPFGASRISISDKERIDLDIARVDNRIRDLDRSLRSAEERISTSGRNNDCCTVYVTNLPFSLTWQRLREKFSSVGNAIYANIRTEDGRSKGYGHVRFESPEEAMMAVRHFNGSDVDGRKISVRLREDRR